MWGKTNAQGEVRLKQLVPIPGTYTVMVVAPNYEPLIGDSEPISTPRHRRVSILGERSACARASPARARERVPVGDCDLAAVTRGSRLSSRTRDDSLGERERVFKVSSSRVASPSLHRARACWMWWFSGKAAGSTSATRGGPEPPEPPAPTSPYEVRAVHAFKSNVVCGQGSVPDPRVDPRRSVCRARGIHRVHASVHRRGLPVHEWNDHLPTLTTWGGMAMVVTTTMLVARPPLPSLRSTDPRRRDRARVAHRANRRRERGCICRRGAGHVRRSDRDLR